MLTNVITSKDGPLKPVTSEENVNKQTISFQTSIPSQKIKAEVLSVSIDCTNPPTYLSPGDIQDNSEYLQYYFKITSSTITTLQSIQQLVLTASKIIDLFFLSYQLVQKIKDYFNYNLYGSSEQVDFSIHNTLNAALDDFIQSLQEEISTLDTNTAQDQINLLESQITELETYRDDILVIFESSLTPYFSTEILSSITNLKGLLFDNANHFILQLVASLGIINTNQYHTLILNNSITDQCHLPDGYDLALISSISVIPDGLRSIILIAKDSTSGNLSFAIVNYAGEISRFYEVDLKDEHNEELTELKSYLPNSWDTNITFNPDEKTRIIELLTLITGQLILGTLDEIPTTKLSVFMESHPIIFSKTDDNNFDYYARILKEIYLKTNSPTVIIGDPILEVEGISETVRTDRQDLYISGCQVILVNINGVQAVNINTYDQEIYSHTCRYIKISINGVFVANVDTSFNAIYSHTCRVISVRVPDNSGISISTEVQEIYLYGCHQILVKISGDLLQTINTDSQVINLTTCHVIKVLAASYDKMHETVTAIQYQVSEETIVDLYNYIIETPSAHSFPSDIIEDIQFYLLDQIFLTKEVFTAALDAILTVSSDERDLYYPIIQLYSKIGSTSPILLEVTEELLEVETHQGAVIPAIEALVIDALVPKTFSIIIEDLTGTHTHITLTIAAQEINLVINPLAAQIDIGINIYRSITSSPSVIGSGTSYYIVAHFTSNNLPIYIEPTIQVIDVTDENSVIAEEQMQPVIKMDGSYSYEFSPEPGHGYIYICDGGLSLSSQERFKIGKLSMNQSIYYAEQAVQFVSGDFKNPNTPQYSFSGTIPLYDQHLLGLDYEQTLQLVNTDTTPLNLYHSDIQSLLVVITNQRTSIQIEKTVPFSSFAAKNRPHLWVNPQHPSLLKINIPASYFYIFQGGERIKIIVAITTIKQQVVHLGTDQDPLWEFDLITGSISPPQPWTNGWHSLGSIEHIYTYLKEKLSNGKIIINYSFSQMRAKLTTSCSLAWFSLAEGPITTNATPLLCIELQIYPDLWEETATLYSSYGVTEVWFYDQKNTFVFYNNQGKKIIRSNLFPTFPANITHDWHITSVHQYLFYFFKNKLLKLNDAGKIFSKYQVKYHNKIEICDIVWFDSESNKTTIPNLCIEIVTTLDLKSLIQKKQDFYFEAGVTEVWLYYEDKNLEFYHKTEGALTNSILFPDFTG